MAGIHHRQPGIFVAASEHPAVNLEIIPDGIHVHPAVIRLLVKLVGVDRVLAITDAMRAAGLADGEFGMGDIEVVVKDGIARDRHGSLAGSTLTMSQALKQPDELLRPFAGGSVAHGHARAGERNRHVSA